MRTLQSLRCWLALPTFDDEDKTHAASLLNTILVTLGLGAPAVLLGALIGGNIPPAALLAMGLFWMIIIGLLVVARRGHIRLASVLLVGAVSLTAAGVLALNGTVRDPGITYFVLAAVMAGLLLGWRAALGLMVVNCLIVLGLLAAEIAGRLPPALPVSVAQGVAFTVGALTTVVLLNLASRRVDEARARARKVEAELRQRVDELTTINAVSQTLVTQQQLRPLLRTVGEQIRAIFRIPILYIGLHDPQTNLIHYYYHYENEQQMDLPPLEYGLGMSSRVMQLKRPVLINTDWARVAAEYGAWYDDSTPAAASLTVPLMVGERAIGVISLQDMQRENIFSDDDVRLLTTIAANVAVAIENARLEDALQKELAQRRALVEALEAKNAELERFTYTVSHDLKSPLVTIRGYLGYLERDARAGRLERFGADMQRITAATDRMQRLLGELLELSRIGRMMNPPQTARFADIVEEALGLVQGRLQARGVRVDVAPDLPEVWGDRVRLVEVVQNLVDNAAKYMGEQPQPRIEIGVRGGVGGTVFYVRDNGMGIDAIYHEKVFGLFDKLDPNSEGTGVGLALVKRIVEVHGGRIWVESQLGQGATFCFTLAAPQGS